VKVAKTLVLSSKSGGLMNTLIRALGRLGQAQVSPLLQRQSDDESVPGHLDERPCDRATHAGPFVAAESQAEQDDSEVISTS